MERCLIFYSHRRLCIYLLQYGVYIQEPKVPTLQQSATHQCHLVTASVDKLLHAECRRDRPISVFSIYIVLPTSHVQLYIITFALRQTHRHCDRTKYAHNNI